MTPGAVPPFCRSSTTPGGIMGKSKNFSYEQKKARWGWIFTAPRTRLLFALFVLYPILNRPVDKLSEQEASLAQGTRIRRTEKLRPHSRQSRFLELDARDGNFRSRMLHSARHRRPRARRFHFVAEALSARPAARLLFARRSLVGGRCPHMAPHVRPRADS